MSVLVGDHSLRRHVALNSHYTGTVFLFPCYYAGWLQLGSDATGLTPNSDKTPDTSTTRWRFFLFIFIFWFKWIIRRGNLPSEPIITHGDEHQITCCTCCTTNKERMCSNILFQWQGENLWGSMRLLCIGLNYPNDHGDPTWRQSLSTQSLLGFYWSFLTLMHLCDHLSDTQGGFSSCELLRKSRVSHFTWFGVLHLFCAGYVHAVLTHKKMGWPISPPSVLQQYWSLAQKHKKWGFPFHSVGDLLVSR